MNKKMVICRHAVYVVLCLFAVAYTANQQMIFTPACLLLAAVVFAALGAEEAEKLKK